MLKIKNIVKTRNMNKKGQMTIFLILMITGLLFFLIFLFVGGVVVEKINTALSQDVQMGSVNLMNITEDTFGQYNVMYTNSADWWGISLIFGMIMGLFLSAYLMRSNTLKWGIILDLFIILAMFITSLYISSAYSVMLDAFNEAGEDFLEVYAPRTSTFMINLPIFVVIIGVIMMVLFHSSIPRKSDERLQSGGLLKGV